MFIINREVIQMTINRQWLSELNMSIDRWERLKKDIEITIKILKEARDKANSEILKEIFPKQTQGGE